MRAALASVLALGGTLRLPRAVDVPEAMPASDEVDLSNLDIDWSELSPEAAARIRADLVEKRRAAARAAAEKRARRQEERERRALQDVSRVARCDFSTPSCWEEFYEIHPGHFDWYQVPASVLEPHLAGVPGDLRVLHVGCGTSTWTKDIGALPRVGSVLNTDINAPAVERMRALYADDERLRFEVMDAANMSLADGSFDVVLDKGLLDIFRPRGDGAVLRTALEMRRVLRSGGLLAFVSYSGREKQPLELAQWCTHHEVRDVNLYTCIKGEAEEQAFRSLTFEPPDVAREEL